MLRKETCRASLLGPAVAVALALGITVAAPSPGRALAGERTPPDVVLVITDDQRAGTLQDMPELQRRVVRKGMRFHGAWIPNPACCPSRASFLTGTYSHTNGVWKNEGPFGGFAAFDDRSTLATWLDDAGYRTGLFGKYLNGYSEASIVPPGWDEWFAFISGDTRTYYGYDVSENGSPESVPDARYSTVDTYREVTRFIRGTPADTPLFALWTPIAPHRPFVPEHRYADADVGQGLWRSPSYNERDVRDKPDWVRRLDRLRPAQRAIIDQERVAQYRTLLSVDDGIARIVRELRRSDRLRNTMLIFASDNGLMWGEHRLWKKAVVYQGASRVPLVIRYDPWLRRTSKVRTSALVSNIDIAPTVMEAVGREPGLRVDGTSLRPLLRGELHRVRWRLVVEHAKGGSAPAYCGVRTGQELFVRYATGEEEYYDLRTDPWELDNLAGRGGHGRRIAELRDWVRERCRPFPPGFSWRATD